MAERTKYGTALYSLLPTGDAWPLEIEDTNIKNLIYGLAKSLEEFHNTVDETVQAIYPGQDGIFLEDWEDTLDLPKCGQTDQDTATRLAQVLAMFRVSPYSNADFFISISAVFGYTIKVGPSPDSVFGIIVGVEDAVPVYFRAGVSSVGTPIIYYQAPGVLGCILNFFKHSHTYITFTNDLTLNTIWDDTDEWDDDAIWAE